MRKLGVDLVEAKGDGDSDSEAAKGSAGVGGHRGLRGSVMGLEMVSLSIAELERLKLLPFLFIESAILVRDKAR